MVDEKIKKKFLPAFDKRLKDIQSELDSIFAYSDKSKIIGNILINHLILEKYINVLVLDKHPDLSLINFEKRKFSEKVKILKSMDIFSNKTISVINAINEIRNHFSHSLDLTKLNPNHVNSLKNYLEFWAKGDKRFKVFEKHGLIDRHVQIANYFVLTEINLSLTLNETKKAFEAEEEKYKEDMVNSMFKILKSN